MTGAALDRIGAGEAWREARTILCVRLDSLGDVLMATPAMRALKESRPGRRLILLTSPAGAAAGALVPEIDQVIAYGAPWMKATAPRLDSRVEQQMALRLRGLGCDAAVIFTSYSQSPLPAAFLCYLAEIPLRLAHCHENPYQLLTDWLSDGEPVAGIRHEARRQLDLVAAAGCFTRDEHLSLAVPEAARCRMDAVLAAVGVERSRPWAVLHPGASAPSRRYPAELYAAAARHLVREHGWQIVFTGHSGERSLVAEIREKMRAPSVALVGGMGLADLAALIAAAPLLIGNNSGPAHVAAAVGTPVVDLYALTNPQHTPWLVPARVLSHQVPCGYCYKSVCPEQHQNCLRLIPPADVVAAAIELVQEVAGNEHHRAVGLDRHSDLQTG
jgi:lipopolysaccharide heptosyltransferase II